MIYLAKEMTHLDGRAPSNLELAKAAGCNPATVTRAMKQKEKLLGELAAI